MMYRFPSVALDKLPERSPVLSLVPPSNQMKWIPRQLYNSSVPQLHMIYKMGANIGPALLVVLRNT